MASLAASRSPVNNLGNKSLSTFRRVSCTVQQIYFLRTQLAENISFLGCCSIDKAASAADRSLVVKVCSRPMTLTECLYTLTEFKKNTNCLIHCKAMKIYLQNCIFNISKLVCRIQALPLASGHGCPYFRDSTPYFNFGKVV